VNTARPQVTLTSGGSNHNLDAGGRSKATIGDRVWEDKNGNGVQDAGETGWLASRSISRTRHGNVVKTTTTGTDGKYSFTVDPGKYAISVTAPGGMTATGQACRRQRRCGQRHRRGRPERSDRRRARPTTTTPASTRARRSATRSGTTPTATACRTAGETGVAGVKVILLDPAGNPTGASATTDASGNYSFTNLKPGTYSVQFDKTTLPANYVFTGADLGGNDAKDSDANTVTGKTAQVTLASGVNNDLDAGVVVQAKLGDTVWEDKNANGVQDAGEAGHCGVTVQLKNATGTVVQTTTGADGKYSFTADPGSYTVSVTAPSGYSFTGKDRAATTASTATFSSTGQSNTVTLASGDNNTTVDAGLYKLASVGDRVWLDTNKNGMQDSGEAGVCGVKVKLLDANGNQSAPPPPPMPAATTCSATSSRAPTPWCSTRPRCRRAWPSPRPMPAAMRWIRTSAPPACRIPSP
jgi:hypothetical protein